MEDVIEVVVSDMQESLAQSQPARPGESELERVLVRILHNISAHPQSERFRRVKKDKPVIKLSLIHI